MENSLGEMKAKRQQRREPRAPQDAQNPPKSERRPRERVPKEGATERTTNEERQRVMIFLELHIQRSCTLATGAPSVHAEDS